MLENLPSLSNVILEKAFQYVNDISVSNFLSSSYKKSVSICGANELLLTNPTVTHLTVNSDCLNELTEVQLNRFVVLRELVIGSSSLNNAASLKVIDMNALEQLVIGSNSFRQVNGGSNRLYVKNCPLLKRVEIGDNAFEHFAVIEIASVPLLEDLVLGNSCFRTASFELKGDFTREV